MAGNGIQILNWINKELPPLSWNVISINVMRTLVDAKINPREIDESTVFPREVVNEIARVIRNIYNKNLPF